MDDFSFSESVGHNVRRFSPGINSITMYRTPPCRHIAYNCGEGIDG